MMKIFCVLPTFVLAVVMMSVPAKAEPWLSIIEKQYAERHPVLFEKYFAAKRLLSSHEIGDNNVVEANALLDEVLKSEINFAPALREYGRLYLVATDGSLRQSTLKNAEKAIQHAIKIEPTYADAYVLLGHVYTLKRLNNFAQEALQTADRLGARSPWLYLNFAKLLEKQNKKSAARVLYKHVIDGPSSNTNAYGFALHNIARNYQFSGDYNSADEWYKKSIEFRPRAHYLTNYANFLLFQLGDADKAIRYGEEALEKHTSDYIEFTVGTAYYTKWARVTKAQGEEFAQTYFDRAREIYPSIVTAFDKISNYPPTRDAAELIAEKMKEMTNSHSKKGSTL